MKRFRTHDGYTLYLVNETWMDAPTVEESDMHFFMAHDEWPCDEMGRLHGEFIPPTEERHTRALFYTAYRAARIAAAAAAGSELYGSIYGHARRALDYLPGSAWDKQLAATYASSIAEMNTAWRTRVEPVYMSVQRRLKLGLPQQFIQR